MRASLPTLSPQQRVNVLEVAADLFGSELPSRRLEDALKNQGVNYPKIIDRTGPICLRRIFIEDGSGLFEFNDEFGEPGFVMAVHATDAESTIDLVAWPVWRPEVFATLFENADLLGGDAAVNPASFVEEPCPIWECPLSWLQADLKGCVVLRSQLAAPILNEGPGPYQCEGEYHARWLVGDGAVHEEKLLIPARRAVA